MATASANFTVILSDRNRHIRELLAREFSREGFAVKDCGTGREAARLAGSGADVLVADADLPDMDALSVLRLVRRELPGLPALVHAHDAQEAGASLEEPLVFFVARADDPTVLVRAVRKVLEGETTAAAQTRGPEERQG
jgi:DNA-binding response OmpR family regulator